ncbi:hypothetical protein D9M69_484490 [compost metagenome]
MVAKLPGEAPTLIEAGVTADAARLQLWDKLAAASGQVELDNSPPADDLPQNSVHQPPAPSDVYAKRRNQASKGGTQA